jgi:hypothetical protein
MSTTFTSISNDSLRQVGVIETLTGATTAWTIKAATNKIQGGVIVNSTNVPGADENTITFSASADTIGDFVELVGDGTNWYVFGLGTSAGAITLTVV